MPALAIFRRKWYISCDDLFIPFALEGIIRTAWLIACSVIIWLSFNGDNEPWINNYFLYAAGGDLALTACLSFIISYLSSRGSIMEVGKRVFVSKVLYVKLGTTVLFDCVFASAGIWLWIMNDTQKAHYTAANIFIQITTVGAWIYVFIVLVGTVVCYNSLGSSKYWDDNNSNNANSLDFFRKAERIWKRRLKTFCCFADTREGTDMVYMELSTFIASFLGNVDLTPTDILAGLILLSCKHGLRREKEVLKNSVEPKEAKPTEEEEIPDWMTVENAIYFLRIAKSTYGWVAFLDPCHPCNICTLISRKSCMKNTCIEDTETTIDSCCYCNAVAMQKITGFSDSDILYSSFRNSICQPAFCAVIDHQSLSIIVAIRGTLSFSDLVTDIDAENELFPNAQFQCHRGALRSATYLHSQIKKLNFLKVAFTENPTYSLVITGHSLGGSIAALLGLLLRPEYPTIRCYIYAPLASISAEGIQETFDFIFNVVVGDDFVSRLSANSCKELRSDLIKCLDETKIPKYKILTRAFCSNAEKLMGKNPRKIIDQGHYNINFKNDVDEVSIQPPESLSTTKDQKLYAPGRILFLRDNCKPSWLTGLDLNWFIVSPRMLSDHQPHTIQRMLQLQCEPSNS